PGPAGGDGPLRSPQPGAGGTGREDLGGGGPPAARDGPDRSRGRRGPASPLEAPGRRRRVERRPAPAPPRAVPGEPYAAERDLLRCAGALRRAGARSHANPFGGAAPRRGGLLSQGSTLHRGRQPPDRPGGGPLPPALSGAG